MTITEQTIHVMKNGHGKSCHFSDGYFAQRCLPHKVRFLNCLLMKEAFGKQLKKISAVSCKSLIGEQKLPLQSTKTGYSKNG